MTLALDTLPSPVGTLSIVSRAGALIALHLGAVDGLQRALARRFGACTLEPMADAGGITSALRRYFDGEVHAIDALTVDAGGTPFQRRVWEALRRIPAGSTTSYGELAAALGQPGASRAVGLANGSNPVAIVVPCHRVIAANGGLGGYSGGLARKRWLLAHERAAGWHDDLFASAAHAPS